MSMKETERLADQFQRLYNGDSWIDSTIVITLSTVSAKQAAAKPFPNANTIWQIVNHLINWRFMVLRRLHGEQPASPDNNFFEEVSDTSDRAWQETLQRFEESQNEWLNYFNNPEAGDLEKVWK